MKPVPFVLAAAVLALGAVDAHAECSVESGSIVFSAYDVYATRPVDAVGTVKYRCAVSRDKSAPVIRIALAPAPDGTFRRRLRHGREALKYNLFIDQQRTKVWGDGTRGTAAFTGNCCSIDKFARIYARIPAGQDVAAGAYVDSITVLLEF